MTLRELKARLRHLDTDVLDEDKPVYVDVSYVSSDVAWADIKDIRIDEDGDVIISV
jgi:hypothetical protein